MNETEHLLRKLLVAFFQEQDDSKVLDLFSEDIYICGLANDRILRGIDQVEAYMGEATSQQFSNAQLRLGQGEAVSGHMAVLRFVLEQQGVQITSRVSGTSRDVLGTEKLCCLHFSLVASVSLQSDLQIQEQLKMTVNRLRQEEEMLNKACDFADLWSWVYDIPNDQIRCSRRLQKDFHMPEVLTDFPESWLSMGFIQPDYIQLHRDKVLAIKNGSDNEEFVCRIRHEDGSKHWTRIRFKRLTENPELAICTAQLIDSEKVMEARVKQEREQLQGKSEHVLMYCISDVTDNRVLEYKHMEQVEQTAFSEDKTMDELMRIGIKWIYTEKDKAAYLRVHNRESLLHLYESGQTEKCCEIQVLNEEGDAVWGKDTMHLMLDPETEHVILYEYVYDINTEKMMGEFLNILLMHGYEACGWMNGKDGKYTSLKIEPDTGGVTTIVQPCEAASREFASKFVSEEERDYYIRNMTPEKIYEAALVKKPIMNRILENGEVHYIRGDAYVVDRERKVCFLTRTDVTQMVLLEINKRKEISKALELAESATTAKSEFLSRMSHEIRTPMNAIIGMTNIARENRSDFMQVTDCLDKINQSSQYLLTLINDILEMSRIESGNLEIGEKRFQFSTLLKSIATIIEALAADHDIRYECVNKLEEETYSYYLGDAMRMQQILVNILTNAIKFTKSGGRVRFSLQAEEKTEYGTKVKFQVADTGIGMSEAFMQQMFHPFTQEDSGTTSKYSGSGLGLAISRSLVEAMHGTIEVDSFIGVGSTFTIRIPLKKDNTSIVEEKRPEIISELLSPEKLVKGKKILLAEDHPMNVMVAKKLLESRAIEVTVAENGQVAVDTFKQSKSGYYDAVLMDIRMPVMDGLEATRTIRRLDRADAKTIPIIAMTANALDEDCRKSKEAGMNAHLAKPFEPAQLYKVLAEQINANQERQHAGE